MEKVIGFLEKLGKLTKETGVVIDCYKDPFYNPNLTTDNDDVVYFEYDYDKETYVARINDPYDGLIVFPRKDEAE